MHLEDGSRTHGRPVQDRLDTTLPQGGSIARGEREQVGSRRREDRAVGGGQVDVPPDAGAPAPPQVARVELESPDRVGSVHASALVADDHHAVRDHRHPWGRHLTSPDLDPGRGVVRPDEPVEVATTGSMGVAERRDHDAGGGDRRLYVDLARGATGAVDGRGPPFDPIGRAETDERHRRTRRPERDHDRVAEDRRGPRHDAGNVDGPQHVPRREVEGDDLRPRGASV